MTWILWSLALIDRGFSLVSATYINITIQAYRHLNTQQTGSINFTNPKHDKSPGCKILTHTQAEEKSRLWRGGHNCYTSKKRTCHDEYQNDHRWHVDNFNSSIPLYHNTKVITITIPNCAENEKTLKTFLKCSKTVRQLMICKGQLTSH